MLPRPATLYLYRKSVNDENVEGDNTFRGEAAT